MDEIRRMGDLVAGDHRDISGISSGYRRDIVGKCMVLAGRMDKGWEGEDDR